MPWQTPELAEARQEVRDPSALLGGFCGVGDRPHTLAANLGLSHAMLL